MADGLLLPDWLAWTVLAGTAAALVLLIPFALHRAYLLLLARRVPPATARWDGSLPAVTVQLPLYNEAGVVGRLIDAAARLDYPREQLEIQVLDDSDDATVSEVAERVRHWQRRGVRIRHIRRESREGYKAGALAYGLAHAEGEFLLVLDADFVPHPSLVRDLLDPFGDPGVGMVQARWGHLNETESLLTRSQALLLDAHFFFEQGGRWASGRFINFNGTAGMWRRRALEEAGGWSADTLTEDLDVSYRAQMAGWRFVFLPDVGVPAELPGTVRAFELQQKRWARGGIQTARKLLPTLLRGRWPLRVKSEAVVHLLGHLAHPLTLLLGFLLVPSAIARRSLGLEGLLPLDLMVFCGATLSFLVFYCAAGRRRARPWRSLVPRAVATLGVGIGLGPVVSRAVLRGLLGDDAGVFRRTPKRGGGRLRYPSPSVPVDTALKLTFAVWMSIGGVVAVMEGLYFSLPFVVFFGVGYVGMLAGELRNVFPGRVGAREVVGPVSSEREPVVTS